MLFLFFLIQYYVKNDGPLSKCQLNAYENDDFY